MGTTYISSTDTGRPSTDTGSEARMGLKLIEAKIRRYRSIEELDRFTVEPDVTCLVGKNESGKTATLQALYKSNAVDGETFDEGIDYPSHKTRELKGDDKIEVSQLTYELDDDDIAAIETEFGPGAVVSRQVTMTTGYRYKATTWSVEVNEPAVVEHLRAGLELPPSTQVSVDAATTVEELVAALEDMEAPTAATQAVVSQVTGWRDSRPTLGAIDLLSRRRPKFVYFGDYDSMPGKVSIPNLIKKRDSDTLSKGEQALLALLSVSGADLEDFLKPESHEHLMRNLENASNSISDEVFEYWTQNQNLLVQLTVIAEPEEIALPPLDKGPLLQIRVQNMRHRVSVPFDERSRGFVWFFSFLAYFSELEASTEQPLILLLDEPGLSLHATAQNDLLRFIDERLSPRHQVLFTTHSPFMVDAHRFERVRTVQDDEKRGTTISADVLRTDSETAFPLHAALGIELSQTLFVGPDVLLVEGPSDVVFLEFLSQQLIAAGRTGLDPRWVLTPGGGIAKLPAFVTLLGANKLNVVVLTDSSPKDAASIQRLREAGRLGDGGIVQIGDILGRTEADVEDLFEPRFYLELVNSAYQGLLNGNGLTVDELQEDSRLVRRVERAFEAREINKGRINHFAPARALLQGQKTAAKKLPKQTLDRAEKLFEAINTF